MTTSNEEYEDMVDYSLEDTHDDDMESIRIPTAGASPAPPPAVPAALANLPSDTELRLTQRVIDLEHERDTLASRVQELEARFPSHITRIPAPSTSDLSPAPSDLDPASSGTPIPIPPDLLPVLGILRQHIYELTRENAALRYTFLGSARPDLASSSKVTLDTVFTTPGSSVPTTPLPTESPPIGIEVTAPADPAPPPAGLGLTPIIHQVPLGHASAVSPAKDVDLQAVVERVKTLMLENEELGDMVAQAGQADGDEWTKTLQDTKAVIESLDSDLTHNLTVIEGLRTEVDAYKARFGSLDGASNGQSHAARGRERGGERAGAERPSDRGGERGGGDRGGDRGGGGGERGGGDRGGDRGGGGAGRNDRRRNGGGGGGAGGGGGGGGRTDERYHGDRGHRPQHGGDRGAPGRDNRDNRDNRDTRDNRDNRDRDNRDKPRAHDDRGGRRDENKPSQSGGISILGRAAAGGENGSGRKEEDRASKRRR